MTCGGPRHLVISALVSSPEAPGFEGSLPNPMLTPNATASASNPTKNNRVHNLFTIIYVPLFQHQEGYLRGCRHRPAASRQVSSVRRQNGLQGLCDGRRSAHGRGSWAWDEAGAVYNWIRVCAGARERPLRNFHALGYRQPRLSAPVPGPRIRGLVSAASRWRDRSAKCLRGMAGWKRAASQNQMPWREPLQFNLPARPSAPAAFAGKSAAPGTGR